MNILFIANRFPYPPYRGDKLKIYNLAKQLHKNNNLFLITFIQDKNDYKYIDKLKKYFAEIEIIYLSKFRSALNCIFNILSSKPFQIVYFQSGQFEKVLKNFLLKNKVDVIHTQHLRMSQYTAKLNNINRILDLPDAYSLYWKRRSNLKRNFMQKIFDSIEFKKILKYEEIIKDFDLNLVCSVEDKDVLEKTHNVSNVRILPNGVDTSTFFFDKHDYSISDRIIFTGNMDYSPNVDAAVYFAKEIFPEIQKKFPKVKFFIVGQKPVQKVLDLQTENIIVTGFVESISDEYNKSSFAVSPIRFGAGTLNKVLEPMAMGIPVISTEVGFKGIGVYSGEGIILAKSKQEFIESAVRMLEDIELRKSVGTKGKNVVAEKYNWEKISQLLEKYFKELIENQKILN